MLEPGYRSGVLTEGTHLTMLVCITALKGVYFILVAGKNNARGYPRGSRNRGSNLNNQKYSNIIEFTATGASKGRLRRTANTIKVEQT